MAFDLTLKTTFGKISAQYDAVRSSYPNELITNACSTAEINQNTTVLEIGCGSGKATTQIAPLCKKLTAIDISTELIQIAKMHTTKFQNVNYLNTSFEDFHTTNKFNTIVCAMTWHWLNSQIKYKKTHDLLITNGHLALFWIHFNFNANEKMKQIRKTLQKHCPNFIDWNETNPTTEIPTDLFYLKTSENYEVKKQLTADELNQLLATYSFVSSLQEKKQEVLFQEIRDFLKDEKILVHFNCPLIVMQKQP